MAKNKKIAYLLVCLMEECAEIQKEASKALRFGLKDRYQATTPVERLRLELNDLDVIREELGLVGLNLTRSAAQKIDKLKRLTNAVKYSKKKGLIKPK